MYYRLFIIYTVSQILKIQNEIENPYLENLSLVESKQKGAAVKIPYIHSEKE